jgi:hypothetical protein
MTLSAGYGARRRTIGNEVLLLWEWLPATIIAVRRGGLPQENIQLHWKPVTAGCAVLNVEQNPPGPLFQKGRDAGILLLPFSKGGWGDFKNDFIRKDHQYIEILRAYGFTHAGNLR